MPRNKTRAIEDIDISIALVDFWMSLLIDQCKLNDIGLAAGLFIISLRIRGNMQSMGVNENRPH